MDGASEGSMDGDGVSSGELAPELGLADAEGSADGSAAMTVPAARSTAARTAMARALILTRTTFLQVSTASAAAITTFWTVPERAEDRL
jgi:hypothetical protein